MQVKAVVKNKKDNTTKIRKIYDVLNVLDCIGVLEKSKLKEKEKVLSFIPNDYHTTIVIITINTTIVCMWSRNVILVVVS